MSVHICTGTVVIVHKCTIMHKLVWVFFCSNCVKLTTFSILYNYARADVIALKFTSPSRLLHFTLKCSALFFFFFWLNKTFCYSLISDPQVHLPFYNNQTQIRKPKFISHRFRNLNIQLPSFSLNAMEFERDLSEVLLLFQFYLSSQF